MRILIVDDEAPARQRLARLLEEIGSHEVAGEAADGLDALGAVQRIQPEIVLLDVRMPRMDGLEVARHLAALDTPPAIIFTTAFDEYALAAFDANAVAYLLKPVRSERLAVALERAAVPTRAQLQALESRCARQHLSAKVGERLEVITVDSVKCFVADQKYVCAHHDSGKLLLSETLKDLEAEFSEHFLRVHRNALVALDRIEGLESLEHGGGRMVLRGLPEPVEVSRRHMAEVRRRLKG